ncbi:methylmalonyl-CoA carboxytransferase subunit 5S [Crateriforma conspicua]|uniref:Methylmalonyl-CoA carboxyltransferase 5S subunit n=1 Tax=Crateriforma conspicua TaxID=2527996 RepID=A0A5C5Y8N4_9PLAN|nr:methylmalonyl-CoA carboxytransferase subunit 5S [Crateriforma conspicua]QDV65240.1 Methylmalonyl-CoA carboxyltransferase 5S subunit [Crateriforma conspicua]TWT70635.1 Methylmalonyl-CoA carboxyltransferase 5S subunit [Crateriforma conspicua]
MTRHVDVTELVLRDGHQSILATRMALEDMVPICEEIDQAGYWSVECWGGATYDSCIRFLNEDPWERLRTFRKLLPNSRLQMLLRGQNLLGYRHYEDTVVDRFVDKSAENGMDVFRVFDALNDIRNLKRAMEAVRRTGKHAEGTICYTTSPLHTNDHFVEMAKRLQDMGCDSICLKDMAALLKPQPAYDIVKGIKEACGDDMLVHVHVHSTTGVTLVSLMKAIEAGADIVDTAISSLSLGPGHNPTEALVEMLEGTGYTTSLDKERLKKIKQHFAKIRPRYAEFESKFIGVETDIFDSQIPGGMISNMESQLAQQGAADRLQEVLEEVPRVREVAGFPPLVTPSSQIVGTQAVFNVLMGPYKALTGEFADLMLGYYGETIAPRDPKIIEAAEKHAKKSSITKRPADCLKPEWDELRDKASALDGFDGTDEDVLTYAMFPQVAPGFFSTRGEGPKNLSKTAEQVAEEKAKAEAARKGIKSEVNYEVKLYGKTHKVSVEPV